jgi:ketosteroid isomerase-like protein
VNTRIIIRGLLAGVMMLSGVVANAAAPGAAEQAVIAAENQTVKASLANDTSQMASLLADNYVSTDQDGTVLVGKAANIADMKLTTMSTDEVTDLKVTVFGDTAIATGTYAAKGTYKGKPFDDRGRFTDSWVKMNGKWQAVATHFSLIKK